MKLWSFTAPWMVLSFVVVVVAQGIPNHNNASIVSGQPADVGEYTSYAIPTIGSKFICGASLIWEDVLLSAGHCHAVFKEVGETVDIGATKRDGSNAKERIPIKGLLVHPDFSFPYNDVMLVFLAVSSISSPLSKWNTDPAVPADGDSVTVIGFGDTSFGGNLSNDLLEVKLNIVDFVTCNNAYGNIDDAVTICAASAGKGSCQGDSGGPLFDNQGTIVGVVSFSSTNSCTEKPSGFARISTFDQWILKEICLGSANPPPADVCAPFLNQCSAKYDCGILFSGSRVHKNVFGVCISKCSKNPGSYLGQGWKCGTCR
jgi:trypsin